MISLRLLAEAEEELRAAAEFYESEQPELGRALLREVRRTSRLISERPFVARIERGDIRVRTIARFPYRIYYRVRDEEIVIIAVAHRRRRPGFWEGRA